MRQRASYYPLSLNIKGKRCVVVGGGRVALRKVTTLLEYGTDIELISPELCPELASLSARGLIHVYLRPYRAGDLQKAFLAFAATDNSSTNKQVAEEAGSRGILVNVADDAEGSDFIIPSSARRGEITIAVSTGSISPALARKIRTKLEETISDEYITLVNLVGEVRAEMKKLSAQPDGEDWQEALDLDLMLELLRKGDNETARTILLDNLTSRHK